MKKHAFTLIELLVVIAVIAVLAALLLPALSRAKQQAQEIHCISNLKQWGLAEQMYLDDSRDRLPTDGMGDSMDYEGTYPLGTAADPTAWFNTLPRYWGEKPLASYVSNKVNFRTGKPTSLEYEYMPFPGGTGNPFWFCPSIDMTLNQAAQQWGTATFQLPYPSVGYFGYCQSLDLNKKVGTSTGNNPLGTEYPYGTMPNVSTLPKPSATVLLFDAAFNPYTEIDNGNALYNNQLPGLRFKSLASRHSKGAVINFCDGHVKYYKDSYLTNGADFSTKVEGLVPDVIWDPAYRAFTGY